MESFRDGVLDSAWISRVTIHELSHNFSLVDSYDSVEADGIMFGEAPAGSAKSNYF